MAKGDEKRARNAIVAQGGLAQNNLNNLRSDLIVPQAQEFHNAALRGIQRSEEDYGNIMQQYRDLAAKGGATPITADKVSYTRSPELDAALKGYGEFSKTGGYSDADIANLRARGISPIRTAYGNTINDIARRINIAGGYSPGATAARLRATREQSQGLADAIQNVNAGLADRIQQGRLAGLGGLSQGAQADIGFGQQAALANQRAALEAAGINASTGPMAAINAQAQLYGTTPGLANTFGNLALNSARNWMGTEQMQQGLAGDIMRNQIQASYIPGTWENTMNRVGQIADIGSRVAAPFMMGGASPQMLAGGANQTFQGMAPFMGAPGAVNQRLSQFYR
jgi:hypothetical protein